MTQILYFWEMPPRCMNDRVWMYKIINSWPLLKRDYFWSVINLI